MAEPKARARLAIAALVAVVVARSAVFVVWPQSHFDSDQAVTGLMAKHLSELRAFPVFWYGQSYMLAVEAWLAAPAMLLFGPTVTALKLPLLAINIAIALLLFHALRRDVELDVLPAAFATLFFALAAPITAAHLLTANGGNVEPLLYVLLLWYARRRPVWLGLILGVGFLNREFTIYGAVALVVLAALRRELRGREGFRRFGTMTAVAAAVWIGAQFARQFSSAAGPGTSVADLYARMPANNLVELLHRTCFNAGALAAGLHDLFRVHYTQLLGTYVQPISDFGIESTQWQGLGGAGVVLAVVALVPLIRIFASVAAHDIPPRKDFCLYLIISSAVSAVGYLAGRCGAVDLYTMRYELLSLLGMVGLAGWYLRTEANAPLRSAWIALASVVLAVSAAAHGKLLAEYVRRPPVAAKQELTRVLETRHIQYGYADFSTAYYVTFMSRERVILAADDAVRIRTYNRIVEQHPELAVRVSRTPCAGGEQVTGAFWLCAR
jgi:hypothetical protein